MSDTTIETLNSSIERNKKIIALANALERLQKNRDFKEVISEGYFREEAIRLVHLKSDPSLKSPDKQAALLRDIDAIGALSEYFRTIRYNAGMAAQSIEADEQTREELLAEGEEV